MFVFLKLSEIFRSSNLILTTHPQKVMNLSGWCGQESIGTLYFLLNFSNKLKLLPKISSLLFFFQKVLNLRIPGSHYRVIKSYFSRWDPQISSTILLLWGYTSLLRMHFGGDASTRLQQYLQHVNKNQDQEGSKFK